MSDETTRTNTTDDVTDAAVASLRDTDTALGAEETRLANELAAVKAKRKAVTKALTALTGVAAPKRGRGRPRTRS